MIYRRLLMCCAVAGALLVLPGCATTAGPPPSGGGISGQIADYVKQAQDAIVKGCGWYEQASVLASIFVSGSTVKSIDDVVSAVCGAVNKPSIRRGGGKPRVFGVQLKGHRVPSGR